MPQAPCRIWRASSSGDSEVLACGASETPARVQKAAIAAALCSRSSTDKVATGVAVSPRGTTQWRAARSELSARTPSGIPLWRNPSAVHGTGCAILSRSGRLEETERPTPDETEHPMPRTASSTPHAPAPAGPYSQCVRSGSTVVCAGQSGHALDGSLADGITEQAEQCLANVLAALAAGGAQEADILRVGVFLTDVTHFAAMNEVYARVYGAVPGPDHGLRRPAGGDADRGGRVRRGRRGRLLAWAHEHPAVPQHRHARRQRPAPVGRLLRVAGLGHGRVVDGRDRLVRAAAVARSGSASSRTATWPRTPRCPARVRATCRRTRDDARDEPAAPTTPCSTPFEAALAAGATAVKEPAPAVFDGLSGYFADPDGHLWEVAHNAVSR